MQKPLFTLALADWNFWAGYDIIPLNVFATKKIIAFLLVLPLLFGACFAYCQPVAESRHDCHEAEAAPQDQPCDDLTEAMCQQQASFLPGLSGPIYVVLAEAPAPLAAPVLPALRLAKHVQGDRRAPLSLPLLT